MEEELDEVVSVGVEQPANRVRKQASRIRVLAAMQA